MNPADDLCHAILGKQSLASTDIGEIRQLAQHYPWFGPAQVLLANKLQLDGDDDAETQVQLLSLHVSNSLWLDQLLKNTLPSTKEIAATNGYSDTTISTNDTDASPDDSLQAEQEVPTTEEELVVQTEEEQRSSINTDNGFVSVSGQAVTSETLPSEFEDDAGDDDEEMEENAEALPDFQIKIPELKIEAIDPAKAELSFEPYHTVDYFASQGIKVKEEDRPKDRFSEQLRSFTDWLKTIRQVPIAEIVSAPASSEEKKVEKLAENSISDREVVTEAMAEVWEKQGDKQKAREIYEKLSLLDPAKSSYFAAKLEHLKLT